MKERKTNTTKRRKTSIEQNSKKGKKEIWGIFSRPRIELGTLRLETLQLQSNVMNQLDHREIGNHQSGVQLTVRRCLLRAAALFHNIYLCRSTKSWPQLPIPAKPTLINISCIFFEVSTLIVLLVSKQNKS